MQNQTPLMYEWYQERYIGAAHGLAGIYYYLMQVNRPRRGAEVTHCAIKALEHVADGGSTLSPRSRASSARRRTCIGW